MAQTGAVKRVETESIGDVAAISFVLSSIGLALWFALDIHRWLIGEALGWQSLLLLAGLLSSVQWGLRTRREAAGNRLVTISWTIGSAFFLAASVVLWAHGQRVF